MSSPQAADTPRPFPTIQIASSNAGKIEEFRLGARLWLAGCGRSWQLVIEPVASFDALPSCEEDGETFAANAQKKARHYSRLTGGLIVADDSGLEVDALNGAPGVRSRRFAGPAASDAENNSKLIRDLSHITASKRTARFVCVIAMAQAGRVLAEFQGVAEGIILDSPRGAGGFGYDPLFLDPESNRTFAEISPEEKLQRSHRGRALRAMLNWLTEQPSGFSGRS
ncbi:MAG: RdgB/HAM1 family non-canonical purine NTP pyrophosphatase [Acidobacteria bacterium]|nr:RdgB/HAM1 family non-canonical purine NTP pyrophosphatase [Acidobacteriota bacterium]